MAIIKPSFEVAKHIWNKAYSLGAGDEPEGYNPGAALEKDLPKGNIALSKELKIAELSPFTFNWLYQVYTGGVHVCIDQTFDNKWFATSFEELLQGPK